MFWTGPDTYVPTVTDCTGFTVPVAVTVATIGPCSTGTVTYSSWRSPRLNHHEDRSAATATPTAASSQERPRSIGLATADATAARPSGGAGRPPWRVEASTVENCTHDRPRGTNRA